MPHYNIPEAVDHKEMQNLVDEILRFAQDDRYYIVTRGMKRRAYSRILLFEKCCKRAASFPCLPEEHLSS